MTRRSESRPLRRSPAALLVALAPAVLGARELQGVGTLDDVEYAVLEKNEHAAVVTKKARRV